jgi:hypothetical protein
MGGCSNQAELETAIAEAERFIVKAHVAIFAMTCIQGQKYRHSSWPKETGALRRSSLDLTRALADMRKP